MGRPATPALPTINMTAQRQPDIVVPIYSPPYTLPFGVANGWAFSRSLWPSFAVSGYHLANNASGMSAPADLDQFVLGPFTFGRTKVNLSVPQPPSSNIGANVLFGNIVYGVGSLSQAAQGFGMFAFPLNLGATLQIDNFGVSQKFFDVNDAFAPPGSGPIGAWSFANSNLSTFTYKGQPVVGTCVFFQGDFVILPCGFGLKQQIVGGVRQYTGLFGGQIQILNSYVPVYSGRETGECSIPDFIKDINYIVAPGGLPSLWVISFANPTVQNYKAIVNFDDPGFQDAFVNGWGNNPIPTRFGALFTNSVPLSFRGLLPNIPGNARNAVLLSPDGTKYSLIRFAPQSAAAAALIGGTNPIGTPNIHIDPSGVFYFNGGTVADFNTVYNSFGLNLPWPGINIPAPPPIALPNEFCPCVTVPLNVGKL